MSEFILPLKDLGMLLNAFYLNGSASFEVHSPHLACRLFSIKLEENKPGARVTHILDRELYNTAYEETTKGDQFLLEEIPNFSYYRFIFLSSGMILPRNWEKLSAGIIDELKRDPLKGQRAIFLSFDTNALITRYYHLISKSVRNNAARCGYVISSGVIDELTKLDNKYSGNDLSILNKSLRSHEAWDGFLNQQKLISRKFKIGFTEFKLLTSREYFEKAEGGTGDNSIISSLEEFSRNKKVDVMVFSEDSDFIEKATAKQQLMGERLDAPGDLPESAAGEWEDICELLYAASIVYGNLQIKGAVKAKISGIWTGKKGESWNEEAVMVRTENKDVADFLERNMGILKRMEDR